MKVGAKVVIIATGGFGNNLEKVAKYSWMPWVVNNNGWIPMANTGEGLDMALQAGGVTRHIGALMMGNGTKGTMASSHVGAAGAQPGLWVNSKAKRFHSEELAEQTGLPADQLKATVDRYNEFCANGYDEDFLKPAKFLRPVATPPFYATWQQPCIIVSQGGVYVNGDFQVCDDYYEPVSTGNLYCVGNDASGLFGDTYNLDCPGTAQGFAHTSGRLAARHAIKQLQG